MTLPRATLQGWGWLIFLSSTDFIQWFYQSPPKTTANVYIDSVFPIRFANWDLRYIIAAFRQPRIMDELEDLLKNVAVHDFKLLHLEPPGCVTRFAASAVGFICLMVRQSEGWRCFCRVRVYSSFRS